MLHKMLGKKNRSCKCKYNTKMCIFKDFRLRLPVKANQLKVIKHMFGPSHLYILKLNIHGFSFLSQNSLSSFVGINGG
eukprot:c12617_g2_i1 orf=315-548(-)